MPALAGVAAVLACAVATSRQIPYWADSRALFSHAIAITTDNDVANFNLGLALRDQGESDAASRCFEEVIRIRPNHAPAYYQLATILADKKLPDQTLRAIELYRQATQLRPKYTEAYSGLGLALHNAGRSDEAVEAFNEAISLEPDYPKTYNSLAITLATQGKIPEAIQAFSEAIRLDPDYAYAHKNLAKVLAGEGRIAEATEHLREAVRADPLYAEAHFDLGLLLADQGKRDEAIGQLSEGCASGRGGGRCRARLMS